MRKETVSPFTGVWVKYTIQGFLRHRFRVDYMGHTFHAFEPRRFYSNKYNIINRQIGREVGEIKERERERGPI